MSGAVDLAQSLQNQKNIEFIEAVEKNEKEKADRYICLLHEPLFSKVALYDFFLQTPPTRRTNQRRMQSKWLPSTSHCMQ
jgi:hypothetical protein